MTVASGTQRTSTPRFPGAIDRGLTQLYAISTVLLQSGDIERCFPEIIALVGEAISLRSAYLAVDAGDHARVHVLEDPAVPLPSRMAARDHARDAYDYLTAHRHRLDDDETILRELRAPRESADEGRRERFLVLPLVVARRPIIGVLQFETADRPDESALLFLSTLANQVAIALERRGAHEAELAESDQRAAAHSAGRIAANTRRDEAESVRERYTALVDGLDQAFVWECDAESLALQYVSARASFYLGGQRGEWIARGASLVDLTIGEDRELLRRGLLEAATGIPRSIDHRCSSAEGRTLWFHSTVHLSERPGGRHRLQGVSFDVTAAKEADLALRDQLELTSAVTGSMGEGVLVADRAGAVTSINEAACALLGVRPEQVIGRRFRSAVALYGTDGLPIPEAVCPVTRAATEGTSLAEDDVSFASASRSFFASYTCTPLRTRGALSGAVMVFRNVSDLVRAEQSQRLIAELSAVLGASLDRATTVRELARFAARTVCDIAILEILGEDGSVESIECARSDGMEMDGRELLACVDERERTRVLRAGQPVVLRVGREPTIPAWESLFHRVGIDSLIMLPLIARERPIGILSMYGCSDDRAQRRPQESLLSEVARRAAMALDNAGLYAHAQRARRVRDDMLAVVSHDLKNPLGAIILYTDSLLHAHEYPALEGPMRSIRRSADKMARLIRDLLDVASIEAGSFSIERRPTAIGPLVADSVEPLTAAALKKNVTLRSRLGDRLPQISVDSDRFAQVVGNLVGNAIKFTPEGGSVDVRVEATPSGVRFSIADTGPGIAEEDLGHVFDRFWQARQTARLGTGLGLFIARAIVEAHGSSLAVESKRGVGTTFSFEIAARLDPGIRTEMSETTTEDDGGR